MLAYRNIDTNKDGANVTPRKAKLMGWAITNQNATGFVYVKLYNQAAAPSKDDTPAITLAVPPQTHINDWADQSGQGIDFNEGIGVRATANVADSDDTSPTANDAVVNLFWSP